MTDDIRAEAERWRDELPQSCVHDSRSGLICTACVEATVIRLLATLRQVEQERDELAATVRLFRSEVSDD